MKDFDISRYLGRWYEVGKLPFKWEPKQCVFSQATYGWDEKNRVMLVQNDCLNAERQVLDSRKGVAWVPEGEDIRNGHLKIRFNDGRPADPGGDYIVLFTDYSNYSFVGTPDKQLFWILSRNQRVPRKDLQFILRKTKELGYDPDRVMSNPANFI